MDVSVTDIASVPGVDVRGARRIFGFVNIHVSSPSSFDAMRNKAMLYLALDDMRILEGSVSCLIEN